MQALATAELVLEPLVVGHAQAMFAILSEPELYRYLDYPPPPSVEHLRGVYARVEGRTSPDGRELWLNWVVSPRGQPPVGYVQITIGSDRTASLGYVFSSSHWGRGYATQSTRAVLEHVASAYGVTRFHATVEAGNERSIRLLERLGFRDPAEPELQRFDLSATERAFVMLCEPEQ